MVVIDEAHHLYADEETGKTLGFELVERLNKERQQNSAPIENKVELSDRVEVEKLLVPEMKPNAAQWLRNAKQSTD